MQDLYAHDDWAKAGYEHEQVSARVREIAAEHPEWNASAVAQAAGISQQYAESILHAGG